jgi:hypothetical protein
VAASARKKRPAALLLTALAFIVVYFGLFPYPLGRELVARPVWAVALPSAALAGEADAADASAGQRVYPFQIGDRFGYVSAAGVVARADTALYRVALSDRGFVNYTRLGTDWIMRAPDGRRLLSFSGNGYPMLSPDGGRLFNVKGDLSGLIELDASGEPLWSRDFPSLMTSASLRGDSLLVGLLDGGTVLVNRQGFPVWELAAGESRLPVVLGTAVSADGELAATVSGIDPQVLTVARPRGDARAAPWRLPLRSDFRRELRMAFSPDARFLVLETADGVGCVDPAGRRLSGTRLPGALCGVAFPARGRAAAAASTNGRSAELVVLVPFGPPVCREAFAAGRVGLSEVDGQLLVALDGWLLRVDVEAL